jgi:hypothetical protein
MTPPLHMTCKLLAGIVLNKCYYDKITLWWYLVSFELSWGPDSSRRLRSCDNNTLGSPVVLGSSIGLSTNLSTCKLGLTIPNVSDGVCCLSFGNCASKELEASPNVDISVLSKTLILKIKHIFLLILSKIYNVFYIKTKKSLGFNKF